MLGFVCIPAEGLCLVLSASCRRSVLVCLFPLQKGCGLVLFVPCRRCVGVFGFLFPAEGVCWDCLSIWLLFLEVKAQESNV